MKIIIVGCGKVGFTLVEQLKDMTLRLLIVTVPNCALLPTVLMLWE